MTPDKIKFGTDGWRAIIAQDFTVYNVARVTQALANWLLARGEKPRVVVGHDCRFGGRLFSEVTAGVLCANGIEVLIADGFVSTPMISLGVLVHKAQQGVVITASHNPPSYNGYKLKGAHGGPSNPDDIAAVEALIEDEVTLPTKSLAQWEADLDLAVKVCVEARLVNSGQSCVAAKRFIVVKELRKEFELRMKEAFEAAKWGGDPLDKSMRIGPMARMDLRDQLHEQVMDSVAAGARILCGGKMPDGAGAFYPPTILSNVKKGMPAYDEELFGPVAAIIEAKDEADAMKKANDSIYGLGGAIFSKDRKRAEKLAATEMQVGNCFVNAQVHSDPHLPFGGTKQSGYGRELGVFGIREFTNIKTVFIQ